MQQGQPPEPSQQRDGFYCQGCLEEAYQQAGLPYTWLPFLEDEPCPRHLHDPRRRASKESQAHSRPEVQGQAPSPVQPLQIREGLAIGRNLAALLGVDGRPTSPMSLASTSHPSVASPAGPAEPKQNPIPQSPLQTPPPQSLIHRAAVDFPVTGELNQARLMESLAAAASARTVVCPRCQGTGVREIGQQRKRCWYCGGRGQVASETYHSEEVREQNPEQEQAIENICSAMRDDVLRLARELYKAEQTLQQVAGQARMGDRKLRLLAAVQRIQGIKADLAHLANDIASEKAL